MICRRPTVSFLLLVGLLGLCLCLAIHSAHARDVPGARQLLQTDLDEMKRHACRKGTGTDCSGIEGYSLDCGALCAYDHRWCLQATEFGVGTLGFGLLGLDEC